MSAASPQIPRCFAYMRIPIKVHNAGSFVDDKLEQICVGVAYGLIKKADYAILESAAEGIKGVLARLGRDEDHFGLIHNDLCTHNIVFINGQACPIDYSDACFGYFYWDMIQSYDTPVYEQKKYWPHQRAHIEGYQSIRPLPKDFAADMQAFTALSDIRWVAGAVHILRSHRWLVETKMPFTVRVMKKYLGGTPFLFG